MCLAIPALVVSKPGPLRAVVELEGVRKEVSLALVDGVDVGDYVIIHVGFALQKLDEAEARQTLAMIASLGAA